MPVRVGVVGATGFIGRHTCAALSHLVDEVVAVTAPRLRTSARSLPELTAEIARCDTHFELEHALHGCDLVLNAAGIADSGNSGDSLYGANSLLPGIVERAAISAGASRFVHMSSAGVQAGLRTLDDSRNYAPISPYTHSKVLGESILGSPNTVIYRPTSVHGADRRVTQKLWRFARSPLSSVAGSGDQPTPQVLVSSVASATTHLLLTRSTPPRIVLHPFEGTTAVGVLRDLGAREPLHIPRTLARGAMKAGSIPGVPPRLVANWRRLEMLWFGQEQARAGWLELDGWASMTTSQDWQQLAEDLSSRGA